MTRQKKILLIALATTCTPPVAIGCNSLKTTQGGEDAASAPPTASGAPAVSTNIAPLTSTTTQVQLQRPAYVRAADGSAARVVGPDGGTIWVMPSGFPTAIPPLPSVFPSTLPPMPSAFALPPMPSGFPTALPSTWPSSWPTALPSASAPKR